MNPFDDTITKRVGQQFSRTAIGESAEPKLRYPSHSPPEPRTVGDLKISHSVVTDLMLRHLRTYGVSTFSSLRDRMKVSASVIKTLFEEMRQQQWIEVKGSTGLDYSFDLTTAGRTVASERSQLCSYTGPAPVSLDEYSRAVRAQKAKLKLNRAVLRAAFADLVVADSFLDRLRPAFISQQSRFLYGPTWNGKTSYSEKLPRLYDVSIILPYAVEVDEQIVFVYVPVVHRASPTVHTHLDARWIVCQRPCIAVGGELAASSHDLRFD